MRPRTLGPARPLAYDVDRARTNLSGETAKRGMMRHDILEDERSNHDALARPLTVARTVRRVFALLGIAALLYALVLVAIFLQSGIFEV